MSTLSTPTAEQLAAARLAHWRHNADPILTINMLRDWLNTSGLVLFTPRAAQLSAPAPSFVEATLGTHNPTPALAEIDQSRSLLSRLILDGGAIPLNLLGNPTGIGTETPDFLVSPLAFPYIFTLRGDKAWKQPPTTTGATKVSPLALNAYTLLTERTKDQPTGLSAYDLATELGKEVTETAVLRALTELWQHLRVIPVPQADGAPTLWELTSTRFTKQIKAGANAGQPSALSALISLYLGQAIVASEEDIETFLSPLAARSRIRDVIHALLSARQLETVPVEGRTVLHVAGELPAFAHIAPPVDDIDFLVVTTEGSAPETTEASTRITKFIPRPRKVGTGFVTKAGHNIENRPTPRERRPFTRDTRPAESARPTFTKPWEEERAARKPDSSREGKRPSFGDKARFAGSRPTARRTSDFGESRPPRREYTPRPHADAGSSSERPRKPFSKPFSKPGTLDRKREGFPGKPAFRRDSDSRPPRRDSESRPPRRDFADKPRKPAFGGPRKPGSFTPRPQGDKRTFEGKPSFTQNREAREPRPFRGERGGRGEYNDRSTRTNFGDRPKRTTGRSDGPPFRKFDAPRKPRSFSSDRPERSTRPERFERSAGSERPARFERSERPARSDRPARSEASGDYIRKPRTTFGAKKPFNKSGKPFSGKPTGGFAKKPGSFAGKKPYSKSATATGKPAGTFDKFKGNKKPFGKRAPARKFKPEEDK